MSAKLTLVVALWLSLPLTAAAASFDCKKAGNDIEKRICASPTISVLDELLAEAYADARQRGDTDQLKRTQRQWLSYARNSCEDEVCLAQAYAGRLAALTLFPEPSSVRDALYRETTEACFVADNPEGVSCEGEAESTIHVTATGRDRGWVKASLWFFNGHSCTFSGAARSTGDGIRAVQDDEDPEFRCELLLRPTETGIITEASENCRMYCGARGSLDRIELPLLR